MIDLQNRTAVLATMHHKEQAIAPILQQELNLNVIVPNHFNTDVFGTFTRDIKRPADQIETAKLKIKKALELTGETIGIASEGSFYPNPSFPLVSCNREIIVLIDLKNNLELIAEVVSTDTNHSYQTVSSVEQAIEFASKIGFPEHALIVSEKQNPTPEDKFFKGITTIEQLTHHVQYLLSLSAKDIVHLETDMRAMFNPTRMKIIKQATYELAKKFKNKCPNCDYPGFDVIQRKSGLLCGLCHLPTSMIKAEIYQCKNCGYSEEKLFPNGVTTADPTYCNYCNP